MADVTPGDTVDTKRIRQRHPDERRVPRSIRFTDDEWTAIEHRASLAGTTAAHYVRCASLQESNIAVLAKPDRTPNLDLAALVAEWSRVGSNLNRIARIAIAQDWIEPMLKPTLDELCALIAKTEARM